MNCTFEGCDRGRKAKGLCVAHYQQQRKGKSLTVLKVSRFTQVRDGNGKVCRGCNTYKIYEDFHLKAIGIDGRQSKCRDCQRQAINEDYRKKKEERQRELRRTTEGAPGSLSLEERRDKAQSVA